MNQIGVDHSYRSFIPKMSIFRKLNFIIKNGLVGIFPF